MSFSDLLNFLHPFTRMSHILLGTAGLVVFWFPMMAMKGSARHKYFGRVFERIAWGVLAFATFGVVSYLLRFWLDGIGPNEMPAEFSLILMLGCVTMTAIAMLYQGRLALSLKQAALGRQSVMFWIIHICVLICAGGLVLYGFTLRPPNFIILIVASIFGLAVVKDGYQFIRLRPFTRESWVFLHMNGMLGTGLAFYVAFGVFGARFLLGTNSENSGLINAMPWLAPILIIVLLMMYWKNRIASGLGEETLVKSKEQP